ncbi:MAG: PDZ domain-containing protein, partial [Stellaceae bacterium]
GGSIGIGFAIPSAMVRVVLEAARRGGKVVRPWLGASGQALTPEIADQFKLLRPEGVLVNDVAPDSPAAAAGLRTGDVILSLAGHAIDDPDELKFRVSILPAGRPVAVEYWRDGSPHSATLALAVPPERPPRDTQLLRGRNPLSGASVSNLNPAFDDEL